MENSTVTARKNRTTRGTGVSSSSMPFHSCPVVICPVTGSCFSCAIVLPSGPVVLVEDAALGAVETFAVGGPEDIDQDRDGKRDQVEQPPALGEFHDRVVIEIHRLILPPPPCAGERHR